MEITESVLVSDRVRVTNTLAAVADLGVSIALDDFGTGYSALSYLRDFAITEVKIDRSFVSTISTSDGAASMLDAIVALVHGLGLPVVAEGVEELRQAEIVSELGCDFAQGYFWARPAPNDEFVEQVSQLEPDANEAAPSWVRRTTDAPSQ